MNGRKLKEFGKEMLKKRNNDIAVEDTEKKLEEEICANTADPKVISRNRASNIIEVEGYKRVTRDGHHPSFLHSEDVTYNLGETTSVVGDKYNIELGEVGLHIAKSLDFFGFGSHHSISDYVYYKVKAKTYDNPNLMNSEAIVCFEITPIEIVPAEEIYFYWANKNSIFDISIEEFSKYYYSDNFDNLYKDKVIEVVDEILDGVDDSFNNEYVRNWFGQFTYNSIKEQKTNIEFILHGDISNDCKYHMLWNLPLVSR